MHACMHACIHTDIHACIFSTRTRRVRRGLGGTRAQQRLPETNSLTAARILSIPQRLRQQCLPAVSTSFEQENPRNILKSFRPPVGARAAADTEASDELQFPCHLCPSRFKLRKHLAVHLARRHGQLSPSRHFSPHEHCVSCMRYFHSVARVQNHLRQSRPCLARAAQVMRPMDLCEIREAERLDKLRASQVSKGHWSSFASALPSLQCFGPRLPCRNEVLSGISEEDLDVARLGSIFRPDEEVLRWISKHIADASHEPERAPSQEFWLLRPLPA